MPVRIALQQPHFALGASAMAHAPARGAGGRRRWPFARARSLGVCPGDVGRSAQAPTPPTKCLKKPGVVDVATSPFATRLVHAPRTRT